jgi:predicted permease
MLRTLFTVGLIAMIGLVALKLVFGLLGPLVGLLFMLLGFAIKVVLIGAVVYFVVRVVSPRTAERIEKALRS